MHVSLDQFAKRLTQSGLLSEEELRSLREEYDARGGQPDDTQTFARLLVQRKKLTKYQAAAIYQGKTQRLVLGNYVILDRIGAGGMGQVFKALHRRMERVVALKVLPAEAMKSPGAVQRFQREAKAAARLEHPNIVTAYDADEADGVHFLVMQFVEGEDLSRLLKRHGPLPVPQAVECVRQAACGLAYAHGQGVVHRDIKPANLLLARSGRIHPAEIPDESGYYEAATVKILDMGLARLEGQIAEATGAHGLTQSGQIMGTVDYMSPEQAEETRGVDHRTDIYSLGCTLWVLLTGKPLYSGTTPIAKLMAHRTQPAPSLCEVRADVPEALEAVYQRMVAKEPERRYQTMEEVAAALADCLAHAPPVEVGKSSSSDGNLTEFFDYIATEKPPNARLPAATPIDAETMGSQPAKEETGTHAASGSPGVGHVSEHAHGSQSGKPGGLLHGQRRTLLLAGGIAGGGLLCIGLLVTAALWLAPWGGAHNITNDDTRAASGQRPNQLPTVPSSNANYALGFDGEAAFVDVPALEFDWSHPLTMECFARSDGARPFTHVLTLGDVILKRAAGERWQLDVREDDGKWRSVRSAAPQPEGQWTHLAAVWDGNRVSFFVDGQQQGFLVERRTKPTRWASPLSMGLFFAYRLDASAFRGQVDEVRVSRIARYGANFVPPQRGQRHTADADTLALYHFDEGAGDELRDATGNHHGKIVGATWVRGDSPLPAAAGGAVDLLAPMDPVAMSSGKVKWHRDGMRLVGIGSEDLLGTAEWIGFTFPPEIAGDFNLEIDLQQRACYPLQIDLPLGDTAVRVSLSPEGSGLLVIDGKRETELGPPYRHDDVRLRRDTLQRLRAEVRHAGEDVSIEVTLDGETVGRFAGRRSRLSLPPWVKPELARVNVVARADLGRLRLEISRAEVKRAGGASAGD